MRSRRVWIPLVILGLLVMFVIGPGAELMDGLVHSDSFRREVESRASAAAGGKVEISEIQFSIWSGVRLRGLATKLTTAQGVVAAKVDSINCSYSLLALLRQRLQLDRVTLENPVVELTQQPPSEVPTPKVDKKPAKSSAAGPAKVPLQVVLESAKIIDGKLRIADSTGAMKAQLEGIRVYADTGGFYDGGEVSGKMSIHKIGLPQNLALADFSTPFKYHAGAMEADPFEASAFGGKITGHYHLDPGTPSTLDVTASDLDVGEISKTANPKSPTMLKGSLSLQSTWHGAETGTLTGEGDAQITHGKLLGVAMLDRLASSLHIRGLADPDLKTVSTHFEVARGTTRFSHLRVESSDFDLTGEGMIAPNGQLDASLVLTLHGGAMGGISGAAVSLINHVPGGGGSIPIHITGTVSSPQTNLSPQILNPVPKAEKLEKTISHLF